MAEEEKKPPSAAEKAAAAEPAEEAAPVEEAAPKEPEKKPPVTHVTPLQWAAIGVLTGFIFYVYLIWPRFVASDRQVLKEPRHYLEQARRIFDEAHGEQSFPMPRRLNAFQDVVWNYEAAELGGQPFDSGDLFRWGYSHYELAVGRYHRVVPGLIAPIRLLRRALHEWREKDPASREKILYVLGEVMLDVGKPTEAVKAFEELRTLRWDRENRARRADAPAGPGAPALVNLDFSPYQLNIRELYRVELLLGEAYYRQDSRDKAADSLRDYLEATRGAALEKAMVEHMIEPDAESRFRALNLLSQIHHEEARARFVELKAARARHAEASFLSPIENRWRESLMAGRKYLEECLQPDYMVYDTAKARLMLAEVACRLGDVPTVLRQATGFVHKDFSRTQEMALWKVLAMLKENPRAIVGPALATIANSGDITEDGVKMAALVIIGDTLCARGNVDVALGDLVGLGEYRPAPRELGAYFKAARDYPEELFNNSPFIDKTLLIESALQRASKARADSDEETAIRIYSFLREHFTVPQAEMLYYIATLTRQRARELAREDGQLSPRVRQGFHNASEFFLMALDKPYVELAMSNGIFEAAESSFEGHFYSRAYDLYGDFIARRTEDQRLSEARHKRGVAALHRKRESRFEDAAREFVQNITSHLQPEEEHTPDIIPSESVGPPPKAKSSGHEEAGQEAPAAGEAHGADAAKEPEGAAEHAAAGSKSVHASTPFGDGATRARPPSEIADDDVERISFLLRDIHSAPRDIWAYRSLLELANAYYTQNQYSLARRIYQSILDHALFSPRSEIWRKASYQIAKLSYDEAEASLKEKQPWPEAIGRLEEVLLRYDVSQLPHELPEDKLLAEELRRENTHIKALLAKAYLKSGDAAEAGRQCQEFLGRPDLFELTPHDSQRGEALLGDALQAQGLYEDAYEHYRRAHDRHLEAYERPFYSLNMAECLEKYDRPKAVALLKRTEWEFEQIFQDNSTDKVLEWQGRRLDRKFWMDYVKERLRLLGETKG